MIMIGLSAARKALPDIKHISLHNSFVYTT